MGMWIGRWEEFELSVIHKLFLLKHFMLREGYQLIDSAKKMLPILALSALVPHEAWAAQPDNNSQSQDDQESTEVHQESFETLTAIDALGDEYNAFLARHALPEDQKDDNEQTQIFLAEIQNKAHGGKLFHEGERKTMTARAEFFLGGFDCSAHIQRVVNVPSHGGITNTAVVSLLTIECQGKFGGGHGGEELNLARVLHFDGFFLHGPKTEGVDLGATDWYSDIAKTFLENPKDFRSLQQDHASDLAYLGRLGLLAVAYGELEGDAQKTAWGERIGISEMFKKGIEEFQKLGSPLNETVVSDFVIEPTEILP